jgi:hypothetical protein
MFQVNDLRNSEEIYVGARLLVSLHEAGVGLCEAMVALEPIAENLWEFYRDEEDEADFQDRTFRLCVDPSILIKAEVCTLDDDREYMGIRIGRPGRFSIELDCHAREDGDFIPFAEGDPAIGLEAKDASELATFFTLTRTLGGELEVDV